MQSLSDKERGTSSNRSRREVPHLLVDSGRRGLYDVDDTARTSATILNAVVVVVLLIICANVANRMLSRAITRRKEISARLSLGATRGRLFRQLFTEALVLASAGAAVAGAARDAVRAVDPNLPLVDISTQRDRIERLFAQERFFAQSYALFGALALLLASIGLFGLMSYNVARRTAEMGIRMALGAQRLHVIRMVMRESLTLVAMGVVAGAAIAITSGRLVASQLFNMPPHHVPTLLSAVVVMTLVSALAAYLPARRASRVDPIDALRQE